MAEWVYFLRDTGTGRIKIGTTSDVAARLRQLSTGASHPLVLLGTMCGGRALEAALHSRFDRHRVHLEWFAAAPELLDFIDRQAKGNEPYELPTLPARSLDSLPPRTPVDALAITGGILVLVFVGGLAVSLASPAEPPAPVSTTPARGPTSNTNTKSAVPLPLRPEQPAAQVPGLSPPTEPDEVPPVAVTDSPSSGATEELERLKARRAIEGGIVNAQELAAEGRFNEALYALRRLQPVDVDLQRRVEELRREYDTAWSLQTRPGR